MNDDKAQEKRRGWGPWRRDWYSICSKHQRRDPKCSACQCGEWVWFIPHLLSSSVFGLSPEVWRWWANLPWKKRAFNRKMAEWGFKNWPKDYQDMSELEKTGFEWSRRFAEALNKKGLKAFYGPYWDGPSDHRDEPTFWYFHPRSNGGIGAYVKYDCDPELKSYTYDHGFLDPGRLEMVWTRVIVLPLNPSREQIWKALELSE